MLAERGAEAKPTCFVIMSFSGSPALSDHYEFAVKPIVEELGFQCVRADELEHNGKIVDVVIDAIRDSLFVIADLTEQRPNCYYELGWAHALGKAVIHLINKQEPIHFDVQDYNFIIYERIDELKERLRDRVTTTVRISANDTLFSLQEALDNYRNFEKALKQRMTNDRITEFTLQDYNDQNQLPNPLSGPLDFHVKRGLGKKWGVQLGFDRSDCSMYEMRPWGSYGQYKRGKWLGLIRSVEDLGELVRRLESEYASLQAN